MGEQPSNLGLWGNFLWFLFNFLFNVGIVGALYTWSQGESFISELRGHLQTEKGGFNILGPFIIAGKGLFELMDLAAITLPLAYSLKFIGEVGKVLGSVGKTILYMIPWVGEKVGTWMNWANPGGWPDIATLGVVVPAVATIIALLVWKLFYLLVTKQSIKDDFKRDMARLPAIAIIFLMYYGRLNILDLGSAFIQFYHNMGAPYL